MNSTSRGVFAGLALAAVLVAAVHAQDGGRRVLDRGRLIVYQGNVPVGIERFEYVQQGDSLIVNASAERRSRPAGGKSARYSKTMALTAHVDDFGLVNYTSNEEYGGHVVTRSILPNDTLLTIYSEVDGGGQADMLERPPGRVFAMDPGLFTLFDVVGRNLQHRIFGSRPVQLIVFGKTPTNVEATASLVGPDTVSWGGRRVVTERIALRDSSGVFTLWLAPDGHMLRLENAAAGIAVMRDPPALPTPAKRRRPTRP